METRDIASYLMAFAFGTRLFLPTAAVEGPRWILGLCVATLIVVPTLRLAHVQLSPDAIGIMTNAYVAVALVTVVVLLANMWYSRLH